MKKAIVVVVLCYATTVLGQADSGIVRLDLKDRSTARNGLPDTLHVYVEIATVQPNVEQGIVFTLNIENNSTETVRIMDPIDSLGINLYGLGHPRSESLPATRPDYMTCFIHSYNTEQLNAMHDMKNANRPFQAFDSDVAQRKPRIKTVSDIVPWQPTQNHSDRASLKVTQLSESERFDNIPGGKLTLEPGERFQAVLQITRVIADRDAHRKAIKQWLRDNLKPDGTRIPEAAPWPKPEIIPIRADKYSLFVVVVLYTGNGGYYAVAFEKNITIQLGEPSSAKQQNVGNTP